jgi:hypothetical protein
MIANFYKNVKKNLQYNKTFRILFLSDKKQTKRRNKKMEKFYFTQLGFMPRWEELNAANILSAKKTATKKSAWDAPTQVAIVERFDDAGNPDFSSAKIYEKRCDKWKTLQP